MRTQSLGLIAAGFWARFQAAAWREVAGARLAAICDRDEAKAAALALEFGIPAVFKDAESMLRSGMLDFVDVVTGPETHAALVDLAARARLPVICQKPMALDYATCQRMVATCREAGVPLLIHENYRWQTPMRRVKQLLDAGRIGRPFLAHLQFSHGGLRFFDRQPYLYQQPHFALFDMGPHFLDLARFFFGEPERLSAVEFNVHPRFAGEDIVSVMLYYPRLVCHCEQTWRTSGPTVFIEGEQGTLALHPGGQLLVEDPDESATEQWNPEPYSWANPEYGFAHPSIVATNANLLAALRGEGPTETTGEDNLKTMRLIHLAMESARQGKILEV